MRLIRFLGIVVILAALAGVPVGVLETRQPARADAVPSNTTTFESGGVGLSQEEWEARPGSPTVGQAWQYYENGAYEVGYAPALAGSGRNVEYLKRNWDEDVDVETAETEIAALLPADALLDGVFNVPWGGPMGPNLTVQVYRSESLEGRFAPDWLGERTGMIVAVHEAGLVTNEQEPSLRVPWVRLTVGSMPLSELPVNYVGEWSGTGMQENPPLEWPITMSLTGGGIGEVVGTVNYPTLGCTSQLGFEGEGVPIRLTEQVLTGPCLDGVFALHLADDTLSFSWEATSDRSSTASGTLERVN